MNLHIHIKNTTTEVWFSHRRPSDSEPYRRFFQVALRFDMEQTAPGVPALVRTNPDGLAGAAPDQKLILSS